MKLEREPLLSKLPLKAPESPHPVDYDVPNFGVDHDILATQKHIGDAEINLSHKLLFKELPKSAEYPIDYPVPNFGVDHDIRAT